MDFEVAHICLTCGGGVVCHAKGRGGGGRVWALGQRGSSTPRGGGMGGLGEGLG